jgi:hypothetical protein
VEDENFYTEGTTSLVRFYLNLLLVIILCYYNKQNTKHGIVLNSTKEEYLSFSHKLKKNLNKAFNLYCGCSMAEAVNHQPLSAEACFSPCGFVVDKVAQRQVFLQVLQFSPVSVIPLWLYILIYHLWDDGCSPDIVSPH